MIAEANRFRVIRLLQKAVWFIMHEGWGGNSSQQKYPEAEKGQEQESKNLTHTLALMAP
jgi:hypothetical protein